MVGGIKLALDDYNKANPDCKISLKIFDSQGDPTKATPLATQIVGDSSIVGLIGPGFSRSPWPPARPWRPPACRRSHPRPPT